jgi:hypothetical protein
MLNTLQVEINNLMDWSSVEQTQHFGEHKTASDCADEWRTYGLPGQ